jgi:hypothetical protein
MYCLIAFDYVIDLLQFRFHVATETIIYAILFERPVQHVL